MEDTIHNTDNNNPTKSYKTLWIMLILFGLPYVAAWYFYFNQDDINFASQTNYGNLISPVKPVPNTNLKTIDNQEYNTSTLNGKWTIISISDSSCTKSCQDNLYKMRQIRKALGQDRYRIERLFLLTDTVNLQSFIKTLNDYEGTVVLINDDGHSFDNFISTFEGNGKDIKDGIFIVDPLGNYMMSYPVDADATGILKDLTRLLKISKIG